MIFLILGFILLLICVYQIKIFNYWNRQGIKSARTTFSDVRNIFSGKKAFSELIDEKYRKFKDEPFFGMYRIFTPVLIVKDPEFIKNVTVKDFSHFMNNEIFVNVEVDPLFGRNPFVLKGEFWRMSRSQLTSSFTGGKMKSMFTLIDVVCDKLVKYIQDTAGSETYRSFDTKELSGRFTAENVATCAFGLNGHCFSENSEFRDICKNLMSADNGGFKAMLFLTFPSLSNILSIKFGNKTSEEKIVNIINQTLKYRRENKVTRKDFIDIMLNLQESSTNFTDLEIAAHAAGFMLDGYETTSSIMCFLLFEVAMNPTVQDKLLEEIQNTIEQCDGVLTYEILSQMEYLDAVVSESLRMYPALRILIKLCNKSCTYNFERSSDMKTVSLKIEAGTPIIIPIWSLSRDSRYYENPDLFNPERFLTENKPAKYTYMPFGEGPRSCLGKRFGTLQLKQGLFHIVKNFQLKVNQKTKLPVKINQLYPLITPADELWVDFYSRDNGSEK